MREMKTIPYSQVNVTGGFWGDRRRIARENTTMAIYDRFAETGRFAALDFKWKKGEPDCPHIFWDSDIAKWIEGAAYLLHDRRDAKLEALIDDCVNKIEEHQWEDGYFNIYFSVAEPENRFTRYTDHELYDLGHLIEAAIAYRDATGKDKFLKLMIKYVDLVDRVFRVEHSAAFDTPGHEEIELALYKLYQATGEERFLTLMRYFIDMRGNSSRDKTYDVFGQNSYSQAHVPVRAQTTAEGHSVRACYLYSAMADLAWHDDDKGLREACEAIFDNIMNRRMYITGGIGSSHVGEAFTYDYDMMNRTAYTETCASLALALFARRMSRIAPKGKYADVAELALYNGTLAGISLDGESFFYENPLEVHPKLYWQNQRYATARDHMPEIQRKRVFSCSCCPPNLLRLFGSIGDFAFTESEDTLYIHHYMELNAQTAFGGVTMKTNYPYDGVVKIGLNKAGNYGVAVRIPGWARSWKLEINGEKIDAEFVDGYAMIRRDWKAGDQIDLTLEMAVRRMQAHPAVHEDCGRVAIMRGPLVFCAEEKDNGENLKDILLPAESEFRVSWNEELQVPVLKACAMRRSWPADAPLYIADWEERYADMELTLIPYFAWANRGEGEMLVWLGKI